MATQSNHATVEAPPRGQEQAAPNASEPRRLPPYQVISLNDDEHTFQYVIDLLRKVFRHPLEKAMKLTLDIDRQGQAAVWTGPKEHAEMKRDLVRGAGPDFYASQTVRFPLGVKIEPMPQA